MDHPENVQKAVLIFDGDCGFCRRWVAFWKERTGNQVSYAAYQEVQDQYPQIPADSFRSSVQWIEAGGRHAEGAEAVFRTLNLMPGGGGWLWAYQVVPGFRLAAETVYRIIAARRIFFSRFLNPASADSPDSSYGRSRWLFLRGMGLIYAVAFASLEVQLDGLIGEKGILPARNFLAAAAAYFGPMHFWKLPTFAWLNASNDFLHLMAHTGIVSGALLAFGFVPLAAAGLCWLIYLSFLSIGQDFLGFQWDVLLVETGFLTVFLIPPCVWKEPSGAGAPSRGVSFLFKWLLFRLFFSSGIVKLLSGDPSWLHLEALTFHYETQPLPAWTSWYAHHLPYQIHRACAAAVFLVELVLPFLIWAGRPLRLTAAAGFILLQVLIMGTGNYGFFNLLTLLLCLFLLDDAFWQNIPFFFHNSNLAGAGRRWPSLLTGILTFLVFAFSLPPFLGTAGIRFRLPEPLRTLESAAAPFHLVSRYGLFAVMTTRRPEIVIEGSGDGRQWKPYEFRYKPGDLSRAPGFVAPYQPRLDWQMWFAALGTAEQNPWFRNFCIRLLEGEKDVLQLLARNPFPDAPPRFLRARIQDYRFTTAEERRRSGRFWEPGEARLYLPPVSLRR